MVRRLGSVTLINAGALGTERSRPCFASVEFEKGFVRYDFFDGGEPEVHHLDEVPVEV